MYFMKVNLKKDVFITRRIDADRSNMNRISMIGDGATSQWKDPILARKGLGRSINTLLKWYFITKFAS